ncbi:hypothetical protein QFC22_002538 [Naganishia vaughanmartiniae]|uniref:Uncharacterized protein n=1 Tax=Naganishia vaughanmartiniae TaxID=1424756 RepID=A0ACC2X9A4_9TREE|nr:hypothetical protein QFC22_002538 [Naganishia vaughanmartiniae]
MDTAFRKIDIDQYDEDRLVPQDLYDPDPRGPDGVIADARNRSAEVRSLLSKGDATGALATILTDCPYGDGVDEAKVQSDYDCCALDTQLYTLDGYSRHPEKPRWSSARSPDGIFVQGKS